MISKMAQTTSEDQQSQSQKPAKRKRRAANSQASQQTKESNKMKVLYSMFSKIFMQRKPTDAHTAALDDADSDDDEVEASQQPGKVALATSEAVVHLVRSTCGLGSMSVEDDVIVLVQVRKHAAHLFILFYRLL